VRQSAQNVSVVAGIAGVVRGCFHAQKEGYEGAGGGWRSYCDHSGAATVTNGALNLTPYSRSSKNESAYLTLVPERIGMTCGAAVIAHSRAPHMTCCECCPSGRGSAAHSPLRHSTNVKYALSQKRHVWCADPCTTCRQSRAGWERYRGHVTLKRRGGRGIKGMRREDGAANMTRTAQRT